MCVRARPSLARARALVRAIRDARARACNPYRQARPTRLQIINFCASTGQTLACVCCGFPSLRFIDTDARVASLKNNNNSASGDGGGGGSTSINYRSMRSLWPTRGQLIELGANRSERAEWQNKDKAFCSIVFKRSSVCLQRPLATRSLCFCRKVKRRLLRHCTAIHHREQSSSSPLTISAAKSKHRRRRLRCPLVAARWPRELHNTRAHTRTECMCVWQK